MSKPASPNSSLPVMLMRRVKRFSSSLSDQAVVDAGVGLFIIVALSILLLRDYQRPRIEPLPAGSVAAADIIAVEDLKTENKQERERMQMQAVNSVLPIYDYNPKSVRDARNIIEKTFDVGREAAPGTSLDALRAIIEESSGLILDEVEVSVLINHRFNPELERLMIGQLDSVMMNGVVERRAHLSRFAATGIIRRDKTGTEIVINDLTPIRDLITARAALRSDRLVLPAEYDPRERRLIGEILGSLVVPNLEYNEAETESRRAAARDRITPIMVTVAKGEPIVVAGETVTPIKAELLRLASEHRPLGLRAIEFAGTVVIVMMLVMVLWQYLVRYQSRH
ncbi:MAG TPA: hypothetical protein VLD57_11020, partial [Blastocatellia bacterium]|nr:hypothetical protein [Blastocatellia bacterium]